MIKYIIAGLLLCISTIAIAQKDNKKYRDIRGVSFVRVVDGDTIVVNIRGAHPAFGKELRVRIADIDAPEMRTSNECEKRLAFRAKRHVERFFENAKFVHLITPKRGNFFRLIADVKGVKFGSKAEYLADSLLRKNLAVRYRDRNRTDWCEVETR
jgi:micrococcal nuclease